MAQEIRAITVNTETVGADCTRTFIGGADAITCLDDPGETSWINVILDRIGVSPPGTGYEIDLQFDVANDPNVDINHIINIQIKGQAFVTPVDGGNIVLVLSAPASIGAVFQKAWIATFNIGANAWIGDFTVPNDGNFGQFILPLTTLEIQNFRAAGGYASSTFTISISGIEDESLYANGFSNLLFEIPTPSGGIPLDVEGTGGFIFGGSGFGLDNFVPSGGLLLGGGLEDGGLGLDPLELTPEGGFIFGGSAGVGGNQITGTGGFIFGGGGRQFMIISPDISGIYFLDPLARHDTFYLRDGDQGTEDVKIPDPFIKTAYIGD